MVGGGVRVGTLVGIGVGTGVVGNNRCGLSRRYREIVGVAATTGEGSDRRSSRRCRIRVVVGTVAMSVAVAGVANGVGFASCRKHNSRTDDDDQHG